MKPQQRWRLLACLILLLAAAARFAPAAAQPRDLGAAQKEFQDLYAAGNYAAALAEAQRREVAAKRAGTNNFAYVSALNDLARAHQALGRYGTAADMFKQVLAALQKNVPRGDPRVAQAMANLATAYLLLGRSGEAEELYKQALAITKDALGPSSEKVALLISNLGDVYKNEARYDEAEAQYKQALDMAEATTGPDSLAVALVLNNMTKVFEDQSRFEEVDAAVRRALAIRERLLGPTHPEVAASLNNLAHLQERLGQYAQAEASFLRATEIWETALGPKHPNVATALLNLASVYVDEDRLEEAEALYKRARGIREAAFGPEHLQVATVLNNLAALYESQARFDDVESYAKRALAIVRKALGPDNPDTAKVHRKLGVAYAAKGRYGEAEAQYQRALDIFTKTLGPRHRFLATVLINEGQLFARQGRFDEADDAFQRALEINTAGRGVNHPEVAKVLNELALLNLSRRAPANALDYSRKATAAVLAHAALDELAGPQASEAGGLIEQRAAFFENHIASLMAAAQAQVESPLALGKEGFEIAQWANQSAAAAAVQQLSPRFGARNDALAVLVREHQDLSVYWRDRDKALVLALSSPDAAANVAQIEKVRSEISATERKLATVTAQLQTEFPDYAALTNPKPVSADDVQKLLGADEALVLMQTVDQQSYVFAVTRESFDWHPIAAGREEISTKVAALRRGLNLDDMDKFDLDAAYRLYALLLQPVEGSIRDKGHLLIIPSGPLTALPFHVLVTEKPPPNRADRAARAAASRQAAWLINRHAISIIPSVASLKVLRSFAQKTEGTKPMIGFGDPALGSGRKPEVDKRSASARGGMRSYTDYWRGAGVDRSMLAERLPPLPDTADELKAVAQYLGAPASDLHLGRDASVTTVKHAPLTNYRVVYFATHGLVAGEVKGLAEPALVLTLPPKATADDDGLLKASEVTQLKLDADWVVLSACNTIAGDRPGAEALSGLARAFFYAGARALLVTHWSIASDAATQLATSTFALLKADPGMGRAEALRRAMIAYLKDNSSPDNAFPAIWGAFALIGEGARQ